MLGLIIPEGSGIRSEIGKRKTVRAERNDTVGLGCSHGNMIIGAVELDGGKLLQG